MKKSFIAAAAVCTIGLGASVATAAQPDDLAYGVAALTKGTQVASTPALTESLSYLAEYGPDASRARSVAAPDGSRWTVLPAANGGVCVQFPNERETVACGAGDGIKTGRFGIVTIARPSLEEARRLGALRKAQWEGNPKGGVFTEPVSRERTAAVRLGIVADGITAVESLDANGAVISRAPVSNNAYILQLGLEGQAESVRLVQADGDTTTSALN